MCFKEKVGEREGGKGCLLFPGVPLCVLIPPQAIAEPGECWWPAAGGGSDGCSCPQRYS